MPRLKPRRRHGPRHAVPGRQPGIASAAARRLAAAACSLAGRLPGVARGSLITVLTVALAIVGTGVLMGLVSQ